MPISFPVKIETAKISSGPKKIVYYPQVFGMQDHRMETFINQTIIYQTQQLINKQIGDMPSTVEEVVGSYEIKKINDRFSAYPYQTIPIISGQHTE